MPEQQKVWLLEIDGRPMISWDHDGQSGMVARSDVGCCYPFMDGSVGTIVWGMARGKPRADCWCLILRGITYNEWHKAMLGVVPDYNRFALLTSVKKGGGTDGR